MAAAEAESRRLQELRLREAEETVLALRRELRTTLEEGVARLQGRLKEVEARELAALAGRLLALVDGCDLAARWRRFLQELRKGEMVWVPRYRQRLRVQRVDRRRGRVRLRGGELEVELPLEELTWVEPPPGGPDRG